MMRLSPVAIAAALMGLALSQAGCQKELYRNAAPDEASRIIMTDTTVVILDVRTREEYEGPEGHLRNAVLIPVQELEKRSGELEGSKERTIVVYCRHGRRSARAAEILGKKGFRVLNLEGGITAWKEKNYPVLTEGALKP